MWQFCFFLQFSIAGAWFFGIHGKDDFIAYYVMSKECHPAWKALALRRLHANQTVDDVIGIAPPLQIRSWDKNTLLSYGEGGGFTSLAMLATDNRLVWASAYFGESDQRFRTYVTRGRSEATLVM